MRANATAVLLCLMAGTSPLAAQTHPHERPGAQGVAVTVQNNRAVPVTVFLEYGVFDRRLGEVAARSTAALVIPAWVVDEHPTAELFVHPEGELDLSSQELDLRHGQRLGLVVPEHGDMMPSPAREEMRAVLPPEELHETTLTVQNDRAEEITVYVERGPFDVRLGRVAGHATATLTIPLSVVDTDETIDVFVHPEHGMDLEAQTVHLRKGEHAGLRVKAEGR